ncbi:MAG: glycoside hydrolase family 43 protein [Bacteroidetes bacterium]|nr:glycoside hydrolase family 43 protein [Bacteroidota bacterium]
MVEIHSTAQNIKFKKNQNPILPGFYPDPSICRAGADYYLVNSSFAYFPGVPIFHSTDLIHWKQIGHILNRTSQLNITTQGISEGIYAPAIRYNKGIFYMVTTFVGGNGTFFVKARNPAGPWSDPVLLPEIDGIDPSFFFDENGKAYLVNNGPSPENKPLYEGHRAIWLQEFDLKTQKMVGERKIVINGGTNLAKKPIWIEGPHIYQKNDYYYLMAAEGGTGENHSEVVFRSKSIWGPYEVFAGNPILTQRDLPADRVNPITCSGHADLVQTPQGDWIAVFLACQPYSENFYNTGRQTFFLPVDWSGEWPVILAKGKAIPEQVQSPLKSASSEMTFSEYSANWSDDFNKPELLPDWNFIRTPKDKWYELKNSKLILQARPVGITEKGNPTFVGRRQQHASCEMTTAVKLETGKELEAGLVAFQNEKNFYKFVVQQAKGDYFLSLSSASGEILNNKLKDYKEGAFFYLRIQAMGKDYNFEYSFNNKVWTPFGNAQDGKYLSTSVAGGFVGTFFGLFAYAQNPANATFDWATYKALELNN